jgi:hypothetical protein
MYCISDFITRYYTASVATGSSIYGSSDFFHRDELEVRHDLAEVFTVLSAYTIYESSSDEAIATELRSCRNYSMDIF